MREIARFSDQVEAEVAASFLRSQGFDVALAHYHTASTHYPVPDAYRLVAADSDAWLATAALNERRRAPAEGACPRCASSRIQSDPAWPGPAAPLRALAEWLGFVARQGYQRCRRCAHIWKDPCL